jgi:hypothetical protein
LMYRGLLYNSIGKRQQTQRGYRLPDFIHRSAWKGNS